jgi:hypothetical protein
VRSGAEAIDCELHLRCCREGHIGWQSSCRLHLSCHLAALEVIARVSSVVSATADAGNKTQSVEFGTLSGSQGVARRVSVWWQKLQHGAWLHKQGPHESAGSFLTACTSWLPLGREHKGIVHLLVSLEGAELLRSCG